MQSKVVDHTDSRRPQLGGNRLSDGNYVAGFILRAQEVARIIVAGVIWHVGFGCMGMNDQNLRIGCVFHA
ncbi:hypothetical protein SDC9_206365 [bioreactor metagenome]|uniref:Uncharacterized protein n=1 Tax=bioreactor metagenome TaxID=1076179 RepID=A0A645J4M3_9ZZZZ